MSFKRYFLATLAVIFGLYTVAPTIAAVKDWSTTPSTNATADAANGINWSEGQAPSSINDSARAMMAELKKWYDLEAVTTNDVTTAVTNVDFDLSSSCRAYRLIFEQVRGATSDAVLTLLASTNGGSSYLTAAGNYPRLTIGNSSASALSVTQDTTAGSFLLTGAIGTTVAALSGNGEALITLGGNSRNASINASSTSFYSAGGYYTNYTHRGFIGAAGINRIRLIMNTGNIASGRFTLECIA